VSYDELWSYTSESSRRLWEELTSVPTRTNSIRFVSTYAGFEGESDLLMDLYRQSVGKDEHPDVQGERIHPDLPIYANPEARIFAYWDHAPRLPWQTAEYYESQQKTLRPGTYLRLHENHWTTSESTFITPEMWDACVSPSMPWQSLVPQASSRINEIVVDPWQGHRSIMTLQEAGLPIREFPQTVGNTTRMGQALFDLLNERNLKLYPAVDLRAQALSTVGVETARGTRIGKEKSSKKIDAIVALAMACVSAIDYGQTDSLFVGVDLATKHDSAAVVAVQWTPEGTIRLVSHRIWQPSADKPLDLERTVEWYLREIHSKGQWANRNREPVVVQLRRPGAGPVLGRRF
jgi:hypothetical protein